MALCPNSLVVGVGKAGSTSLHNYLSAHPEIYGSEPKELVWFTQNYDKGQEWRKANFRFQCIWIFSTPRACILVSWKTLKQTLGQ